MKLRAPSAAKGHTDAFQRLLEELASSPPEPCDFTAAIGHEIANLHDFANSGFLEAATPPVIPTQAGIPAASDSGEFETSDQSNDSGEGDPVTIIEPVSKRLGRPKGTPKFDPTEDRKIAAAWKKGEGTYNNKDQLDRVFNKPDGFCRAAIDRHRHKKPGTNS